MQELKVLRWCDQCYGDTRAYVEAVAGYVIQINTASVSGRAMEPRTLDLCETHADPVNELKALLVKAGTVVKATAEASAKTAPRQPQSAPSQTPGVPTQLTLDQDEPDQPPPRKKYGRDLEDMDCPVCAVTVKRGSMVGHLEVVHKVKKPKVSGKCPDCGTKFTSPGAAGIHRYKAHGFTQLKAMLDELAAQGVSKP